MALADYLPIRILAPAILISGAAYIGVTTGLVFSQVAVAFIGLLAAAIWAHNLKLKVQTKDKNKELKTRLSSVVEELNTAKSALERQQEIISKLQTSRVMKAMVRGGQWLLELVTTIVTKDELKTINPSLSNNYITLDEFNEIMAGIEDNPYFIANKNTLDKAVESEIEREKIEFKNRSISDLAVFIVEKRINALRINQGALITDLVLCESGQRIHQCPTLDGKRKSFIDFMCTLLTSENVLEDLPRPHVAALEHPNIQRFKFGLVDKWIKEAKEAEAADQPVQVEKAEPGRRRRKGH